MMKRKRIGIAVIVIMMISSGCGRSKSKIVGEWKVRSGDETLVFFDGGEGYLSLVPGEKSYLNWNIKGQRLLIDFEDPSIMDEELKFRIEGNALTLSFDGGEAVYQRAADSQFEF